MLNWTLWTSLINIMILLPPFEQKEKFIGKSYPVKERTNPSYLLLLVQVRISRGSRAFRSSSFKQWQFKLGSSGDEAIGSTKWRLWRLIHPRLYNLAIFSLRKANFSIFLTNLCFVFVFVLFYFFQELLRAKKKVLEAASERGLLQKALLRSRDPPGGQVTGPFPDTNNQYPVECGPMSKEQFQQV